LSYLPYLNSEVFELVKRNPKDYCIKKFDLTVNKLCLFNTYREVLNQIDQTKFTNKCFIETFKPFLIFYKSLVPYSQNTKNLSKEALGLRDAISKAIDPEKTFFEDFPKALGLSLSELTNNEFAIESYAITIKESIQEIDGAYNRLINEIESYINQEILGEELDYPNNKKALQERYHKIKADLLKPNYKVFYKRIVTVLDDRMSWISSICQVTLGKSLDAIQDEEIPVLKYRILENIRELDNYTELSKNDIDLEKEEVIKLEVTSFLKGLSKKYIRIPRSKYDKITAVEESIRKQLKTHDKTFNIALLTRLLQDEINEENEN
jgi:hypothetical protein